MRVQPYSDMVLGIGALASLGLALPTGMAFGYGYGYGVRAGYNAYKKPSSEVEKLKLSPNPVTGALGAGLQSAEERTGQVAGIPVMKTPEGTISQEPSIVANVNKVTKPTGDWRYNQNGFRADVSKMTREEYRDFVKGRGKWSKQARNVIQKRHSNAHSGRAPSRWIN